MDNQRLADPENARAESTPLLSSDSVHISQLRSSRDWIACHIAKIHGEESWVFHLRRRLQHFLTSKWGHYFVLILVALDITCIFADFLISLHICEHGGDKGFPRKRWKDWTAILGVMSLVFSSLFMAELVASVFAFGFSYFRSAFHIFDALVILASFVIDVLLHGPVEEVGSLIIVLRLWRIVKIIEEFGAGATEETDGLYAKITELQQDNEKLQKEKEGLKRRIEGNADGSGRLGFG